jgi:hypothetical protein
MARPIVATAPPTTTSSTQWFAVATTAHPIAAGIITAGINQRLR